MAKNHYVPKLILRNFDEKISIFNLKTGELVFNKKLDKIFVEKDLYSPEIEDMFNKLIENDIAILIKKKILTDNYEIILKRTEVNKFKKFLLLQMLRTFNFTTEMKADTIGIYRKLAENWIDFNESDEIKALGELEYWYATLKCVLETDDLVKVKNNKNATAFAVWFAEGYNSSYLGIWDSTQSNEDFVVMDTGMISEHEKTIKQYCNRDAMKRGYLHSKVKEDPSLLQKYYPIMITSNIFHENFYFHSLSKSRMIVLINPFFRLYDEEDAKVSGYKFNKPDIEPTLIFNEYLLKKNKVKYLLNNNMNPNDEFIYEVKSLTLRETIYINSLTLDRIEGMVGFSESSKIIRSVITYNSINGKLNNYDSLISKIGDKSFNINLTRELKEFAKSFTVKFISNKELFYMQSFINYANENGANW